MVEELRRHLNLIIQQQYQSYSFLSCSDTQWQAFIQQYSTSNTISNLLTLDWWRFIWEHLPISRLLLISTDLLLYSVVFILILQFGLLYSTKSAHSLLNISGDHSRRFVGLAFLLFCAQLVYFYSTNLPVGMSWAEGFSYLHGLYQIDYFTQLAKFFMFLIWLGLYRFLDSLASSNSQGIAEFPILSHLTLCFSLTLVSVGDFALLLICLEGFSLILYIMATIGRLHGGITAAAKYFAFGTAGSVLVLWGAIHFYEATASLSFRAIFYAFEYLNEHFYRDYLMLAKFEWAAAAVLMGLLIKLGAAPTHQWVPDVYAGVPVFITAFYAIFVKFVLYVLFIRLAYHFNTSMELEYAAIVSLIVGCFGTLRQVEIKRFLAYGSITHIGFLLLGDVSSSLVYLAAYVLASFVFFSVLLTMRLNGQEFIYLNDLRHIAASTSQWDRILLVLALASMAGLPPFAGFYGKMMIWSSLMEDVYLFDDLLSYILLLLNFVVSLVVIFYYMRLIVLVYIGDEDNDNVVVDSYLFNFWKDTTQQPRITELTADFNDKQYPLAAWKSYRQDVVEGLEAGTLFAARSSYRQSMSLGFAQTWNKVVREDYIYNRYITLRGLEIKNIQYYSAALLVFWTLLMPSILTTTVVIAETLALTWTV